MKKRILVLIFTIFLFSAIFAFSKQNITFIYSFIIDTSGSMSGLPKGSGNVNIFPKVKSVITKFIQNLDDKDCYIYVVTFNSGVKSFKEFLILKKEDKQKVVNYINSLKATGNNTWIYKSLDEVFNKIYKKRKKINNKNYAIFYLLTDGLDNSPSSYTLDKVLNKYKKTRYRYDWFYYCTLSVKLPYKIRDKLVHTPYIKLIEEKKGQLHPFSLITPDLFFLDFGNLKNKKHSCLRSLKFSLKSSEKLDNIKIYLKPQFKQLEKKGVLSLIEPDNFKLTDKIINIKLKLKNWQSLGNLDKIKGFINISSDYSFLIIIPDKIKAEFSYLDKGSVNILKSKDSIIPFNFNNIISPNKNSIFKENKFILDFNSISQKYLYPLKVRVILEKNIKNLHIYINDKESDLIEILPDKDNLDIKIKIDPGIKPGDYKGRIELYSDKLLIKPEKSLGFKNIDNKYILPFSLHINPAPLPLYKKIIKYFIILFIAFIILYFIFKKSIENMLIMIGLKKAKFLPASIEIVKPKKQSIDLTNLFEIKLGKDGDYIKDMQVSLILYPLLKDGKNYSVLKVLEGEILINRYKEKDKKLVKDDIIYLKHNDIIIISNYQLKFNSFYYNF